MRMCNGCHLDLPDDEFTEVGRSRCKTCRNTQRREAYRRCGGREKRMATNEASRQRHLTRNRERDRAYRAKLKADAFGAYGGPVCTCCGITESIFLTLDHIDGGGEAHRRNLATQGTTLYLWLKANSYPAGFQVLCFNCNWAKSHGGCPHSMSVTTYGGPL